MYRQNTYIKSTVDAKLPTFKFADGSEFTVRQILWNTARVCNQGWRCKACGSIWKGIKKLKREGRTPKKCPRCNRYSQIEAVTIH